MRRNIQRCPHGKLLVCTQRHTENHPSLGRPLCLDCYDHARHVVWNAWAGELWRRTTIAINRALRKDEKAYGIKLRISYGKVAEYQRRGVVHFHALIRLDRRDPEDPDAILAPPARITAEGLALLVEEAAHVTHFQTPGYADTGHTWDIEWGRQIDVRPVGNLGTGQITSEAVAAYLAKYATKATETTGLPPTGRMTAEAAEHYSDAHTHLGRLIAYAFQLGTPPSDWTTDEQQADWHATWGRSGAGPTCSASAATSPPRAAATPPPTKPCARSAAPGTATPVPTGADATPTASRSNTSTTTRRR
ncbi:hypothetical protein BJF90_14840 [Pseudonocardia sp. CNS-004]|nr:hypothetical protein BJF90_14840 [Pseudonocardia sp. CNS-004]